MAPAKKPTKPKRPPEKRGKQAEPKVQGISVAGHPHASHRVRQAKGLGGLIGFIAAAYLSSQAGVPLDQLLMRAVLCGAAGYLISWACAVTVYRQLVLAELRLHHERVMGMAAAETATVTRHTIDGPQPGHIAVPQAGAIPMPAPGQATIGG